MKVSPHLTENQFVGRDFLLAWAVGATAIMLVLLVFAASLKTQATADTEPPGNVIIEASWDNGVNVDVDLWTRAPGDVPVGYSNKGGVLFNLLRDDLGFSSDTSGVNYEVQYSRGIVAGEYVVNLHLYRGDLHSTPPYTVLVRASVKRAADERLVPLVERRVTLRAVGEELTAFRFKLTADGELIPDSLTNLYVPLRSAEQ